MGEFGIISSNFALSVGLARMAAQSLAIDGGDLALFRSSVATSGIPSPLV